MPNVMIEITITKPMPRGWPSGPVLALIEPNLLGGHRRS
jgi:hypothetical protein